jgi:Cu2+-exporting ATPase
MMRMMEAAEGGRSVYRRIAERVSSWYAPVVHLGALATFAGWMVASGDWHRAMTIAIAVLIITCPCALGLAVPIVQVVAARRLFEAGIMVKDGTALERLAEADSVVLDKTGTLTASTPRLANADRIDPEMLETAAALAALSRHPRSRAIAAFASGTTAEAFDGVRELSGLGIEARSHGRCWRLGRRSWAVTENGTDDSAGAGTVLSMDGREVAAFEFDDRLRPGVRPAVAELAATVGPVEMLSGDTNAACRQVACRVGIAEIRAELLPTQKVQRLATLAAAGRKVLMVGDGLNDAPALATAHVSMAPGSAADVGRDAADLVFLRDDFGAVPLALKTARRADRLVRQNLALAVAYNAVAVPIAVFGHVTPLIAAIAMSASSILVIANALRLGSDRAVRDDGVPAPVEVAA